MKRTKICWLCGKKYRGNHYIEIVIDGHPRQMHKQCGEYAEEENGKDIMQANHRSPFGMFS